MDVGSLVLAGVLLKRLPRLADRNLEPERFNRLSSSWALPPR
jgi:hypothetical protein